MIVKLLTEHRLEFLSLKGGCRGSSESTHVKMPHCWKSHATDNLVKNPKHLFLFQAVLNYLRTGELHLPSYVCGPAAKTELTYWGVPPHKIERCCWTNYSEWNTTLEALQRLEKDRKLTQLSPEHTGGGRADARGCWKRWRPVVWRVLSRSNSSTVAKVTLYVYTNSTK